MTGTDELKKARENVKMRAGDAGQVIEQDSGVMCDVCEEANYMIVKGWESDKAYKCPNCNQYHYWIGNIHCSAFLTYDGIIPPKI